MPPHNARPLMCLLNLLVLRMKWVHAAGEGGHGDGTGGA